LSHGKLREGEDGQEKYGGVYRKKEHIYYEMGTSR